MFDETDAPLSDEFNQRLAQLKDILPWLSPMARQAPQLCCAGIHLAGTPLTLQVLQQLADHGNPLAKDVLMSLSGTPAEAPRAGRRIALVGLILCAAAAGITFLSSPAISQALSGLRVFG